MIAFRKQAYFLPCLLEQAVFCILPLRDGNAAEAARKEEIDFSRMARHDCFMMKGFTFFSWRRLLLGECERRRPDGGRSDG